MVARVRGQRIQEAFFGLFQNFPVRPAAWLRCWFPGGRPSMRPDDFSAIGCPAVHDGGLARDRLTAGMFIHRDQADPVGRLELALAQVAAAEEVEGKVRRSQIWRSAWFTTGSALPPPSASARSVRRMPRRWALTSFDGPSWWTIFRS
jgi:hypothetical protein